jgi:hypothetical protein
VLAVLSDSYVPQSTHLRLLYSETSRKRSRTILVCLWPNQRERQVRSYAKSASIRNLVFPKLAAASSSALRLSALVIPRSLRLRIRQPL